MAEPFKNLINAATVRAAGLHLQRAWGGFDRAGFERQALKGLADLELKARAMHLGDALQATLPADFSRAAEVIEASLAPPLAEGEGVSKARDDDAGLSGWVIWPLGEYVARRGLESPQRGLAALHALTQRLTAEWAIRPFIVRHPEFTFATLQRWTTDPSAHVRRLVSEGSRPRLPWGLQLKSLVQDPSPTLPLLRALQDDPSAYVRRSVANHLNDIAKDHPQRVAQWLAEHLPDATAQRQALLRHASRTLIKQGDAAVLRAWGQGAKLRGDAGLTISPRRIALGDGVTLEVALRSRARQPQSLVIDYAVHHIKANGSTSAKVFKGWTIELAASEHRVLRKGHPVKLITTRRYFAGEHRVDLLVNGQIAAQASFELVIAG